MHKKSHSEELFFVENIKKPYNHFTKNQNIQNTACETKKLYVIMNLYVTKYSKVKQQKSINVKKIKVYSFNFL